MRLHKEEWPNKVWVERMASGSEVTAEVGSASNRKAKRKSETRDEEVKTDEGQARRSSLEDAHVQLIIENKESGRVGWKAKVLHGICESENRRGGRLDEMKSTRRGRQWPDQHVQATCEPKQNKQINKALERRNERRSNE